MEFQATVQIWFAAGDEADYGFDETTSVQEREDVMGDVVYDHLIDLLSGSTFEVVDFRKV